jgi:pyruvate formate lyase activating enzyme
VTVSGGEPLLQPAFTAAVLRGCAERGVHTVLDTSGAGADRLGEAALDGLLADVDLCLLDLKSFDPDTYRAVTGGGDVRPTLDLARRMSDRGLPLWIRFVLVPGVTDADANVAGLADFVAGLDSVQRVDVLPFHTLGAPKYEALGIPFPLDGVAPPTPERTRAVREVFQARGLPTT